MSTNESLIDRLLQEKTSRTATDVYGGVSSWWKQTFGGDMPVRNLGSSQFERKAGWEHSRSFDVGLHPSSDRGQQLISYLQQNGIPFAAFTGAVKRGGVTVATGPHIHVGPPSQRLGSTPAKSYDTQLTPDEEIKFKYWKQHYAPNDSGEDYDLRGAFKASATPDPQTGHWPDRFKKPNYPTFSNESQYAVGDDAARAGHWEGEKFVPSSGDSLVERLLAQKSQAPVKPLTAADRRGVYGSAAYYTTHPEKDPEYVKRLNKLAHDIDWHFGYGVLMAMPTLAPEKQQQIVQLATEYATADEAKKKSGAAIVRSPAWQLLNQQRVGVVEGKDIEARTPPDVDAAQKAAFRAGANPLLRIPDKMQAAWMRPVAETLVSGAGGLMEFGAGLLRGAETPASTLNQALGQSKANLGADFLQRHARRALEMATESQDVSGRGGPARITQGVGSGLIEYAPLALMPEVGLESVMARIGLLGLSGGTYSGLQSVGRGEGQKDVAKHAATGAALFGLLGVPLPGKNVLTKQLSNLVITGGGTALINRATGEPWDKAATSGLVMFLIRQPELIGSLKVQKPDGALAPATPREIRGLLPSARFEMETNTPVPEAGGRRPYYRSPQGVTEAAQQSGRKLELQPGQQDLYGAIRPGTTAGREDLPGMFPPTQTFEEFAAMRGLDYNDPRLVPLHNIEPRLRALYNSYKESVARGGGRGEGTITEVRPRTQVLDYGNFIQSFFGMLQNLGVDPQRLKNEPLLREKAVNAFNEIINEQTNRVTTLAATYSFNPQQMLFPLPGPVGERVPTYGTETAKPVDLTEAGLSQQYPGVLRMSEETARLNLQTLKDLQESPTWKKLSKGQKEAIDTQIQRLEGQGAGALPEKPAVSARESALNDVREAYKNRIPVTQAQEAVRRARILGATQQEIDAAISSDVVKGTGRERPRWTTREQLAASEEKLRLMQREQQASANVSRETYPTESVDQRVKRYSVEDLKNFVKSEKGELDLDELRWILTRKRGAQELGDVEKPRPEKARSVEAADRYVAESGWEQAVEEARKQGPEPNFAAEQAIGEIQARRLRELKERAASGDENARYLLERKQLDDVIDLTEKDVDFKQKVGRFLKDEEGSFDPEALRKRIRELLEKDPSLTDEELKLRLREDSKRGQEGTVTLDAITGGMARKINTVRQTISTLARTRGVRAAMAYTRDAGDNAAMILGQRAKNSVLGPMREILGGMPKEAPDALSLVIESRGNQAELANMKAKITASPDATPGWVKRATAAIDYANAHYAELLPIAERYKVITDAQRTNENTSGIDVLHREGYVMHAQDIEGPTTGLLSGGAGDVQVGFKRVRQYETFADSIAAGVNPKTLDALDLLSARVARGQRLINRRQWVSDLRTTIDTHSGEPIVKDPVVVKRADGSTYHQPPPGYSLEYNGFEPIAVRNGYEGIYSALTDPSWFSKNAATRGFMQANATGKSISLMLDTFHLGRLAFWQSLIKSLGIKTAKLPLPSYRKGLTLLDATVPEIQRMAARGEIPAHWTNDLLESKRRIDLLVEKGFNVGGISDALYQDVLHALPVVGPFNKWLFSQFQRGAMTEVGLLEFQRRRTARPAESEAVTAREVAKDLNTRFGNLGQQGLFKSRTAQDLARTFFLAPQWNEGLIRSEVGAVKQAGQMVVDVVRGQRIYSGVLLRSVGAMALGQFVANQLINYGTRGHPTWENPEEGWGAKVSAWIPDKLGDGPGFFLHPLGLAAETTHLLMKGYERTEDFSAALNDYMRSRASSTLRPVLTFITRRDFLGRSIKPGNVWSEVVKSAIPSPIPSKSLWQASREVVTGKHSEEFPGQYQKQLMSSFGLKVENAPSEEKRIRDLATSFNRKHGIEKEGDFPISQYQELMRHPSKEALEDVIQEKIKNDFTDRAEALKQVRQYYKKRADAPFTGSNEREKAFKKTLNPEQLKLYNRAMMKRAVESQAVIKILN